MATWDEIGDRTDEICERVTRRAARGERAADLRLLYLAAYPVILREVLTAEGTNAPTMPDM